MKNAPTNIIDRALYEPIDREAKEKTKEAI